jgi:L,D-peptidoglycan transpeptidase YkuD (ErfK/YbiS/YcfS/YnhG family)
VVALKLPPSFPPIAASAAISTRQRGPALALARFLAIMDAMLRALLLLFSLTLPAFCFELPARSRQVVLGIAPDWDSSRVSLTLHERSAKGWVQVAGPWSGRLGRDGLVWGLGSHPLAAAAQVKKEGDWRAPAGVFPIGGVWGYERAIRKHPRLSYRQVTPRDLWIEDPASPSYNRNLILDHDPATAWEKKQQMKQDDPAHALKLFIAHNAPPKPVPGRGSAIFFHIWRANGTKPTAGCTTMAEDKLRQLIAWLDPGQQPLYVLLPRAEYLRLKPQWRLP